MPKRNCELPDLVDSRKYVAAVASILLTLILMWGASERSTSAAAGGGNSVKTAADKWASGLVSIPERTWGTASENVISAAKETEESLRGYEMRCLPNRARVAWFRSGVEGDCSIQWVMLPGMAIKTVRLVPEQFEKHLRIDDLIVSPDSSAIWIRLGRSVGESDRFSARYFKYDVSKDALEYTDEQLQQLVEDTKGDRQYSPSHPVWSTAGHKFYEGQDAAVAEGISYTADFWPALQDNGPVHISIQDAAEEVSQWVLCPGLRGRGHVFGYLTGTYICTVQLSSQTVGNMGSPLFVLAEKQGPTVYMMPYGTKPWKSVLKGRRGGVVTMYIPGLGVFFRSQDAERVYLDFVAE